MKKRIVSFLMALVMAVSLLPVSAFAANGAYKVAEDATAQQGEDNSKVTVYFSLSDNGKYKTGTSGKTLAYVPVTVEYFDLDDYGLGKYTRADAGEQPTVLHLFIKMLEQEYLNSGKLTIGGDALTVSGGAGSMYMTQFWGHDQNLTYYVNHVYPIMSGSTGATADWIILKDGDVVDVAMFDDWSFWSDAYAGFQYFMDGDAPTHSYTATAGEAKTITCKTAQTNMMSPSGTQYNVCGTQTVYYGKTLFAGDAQSVTTDSSGAASITFPEAGDWYVWANGAKGKSTSNVVSSPAYAAVTVEAGGVTTPKLTLALNAKTGLQTVVAGMKNNIQAYDEDGEFVMCRWECSDPSVVFKPSNSAKNDGKGTEYWDVDFTPANIAQNVTITATALDDPTLTGTFTFDVVVFGELYTKVDGVRQDELTLTTEKWKVGRKNTTVNYVVVPDGVDEIAIRPAVGCDVQALRWTADAYDEDGFTTVSRDTGALDETNSLYAAIAERFPKDQYFYTKVNVVKCDKTETDINVTATVKEMYFFWPLGGEAPTDIKAEGATLYTPQKLESGVFKLLMDKKAESARFLFRINADKAYLSDAAFSAVGQELSIENGYFVLPVNTADFGPDKTFPEKLTNKTYYVVAVNPDGRKTPLRVTALRRDDTKDTPDAVVDYLCLASQYTNNANHATGYYGTMPERTLAGYPQSGTGMNMIVSLGNFGGYITYRFDQLITNDPNHPYGVDFVVRGNNYDVNHLSFYEPANVLVSQDGETWYTLAGSDHYSNNAYWDYTMTYTKSDKTVSVFGGEAGLGAEWTDNYGNKGISYLYPLKENYPLFQWSDALEQSITVSGTLLEQAGNDPYGSGAAATPKWGYADTCYNGLNPYTGDEGGEVFDLDWAVDENGQPVQLDWVKYVKVQTASNIDGGSIGEKSAEISAIYKTDAAAAPVGVTAAPASISINGQKLALKDGVDVYSAVADTAVEVAVDAPEGANVYINDVYGKSAKFDSLNHRMVRVVVQEGEKEPVIYYVNLKTQAQADEDAVADVIAKINAIGTVTLDSKSAIDEARKAYDKLTAAQQAKVSNYATLTAAETTYAKLVADKADQDAADAVVAKIDAIGTVTLDSKKAIDAARKAYDKLTAAQQARVNNYATLTTAETTYAKLVQDKADQDAADAVIAKINAIGVVSRAAKSRIDAARKAYDGLTDAQKALVPASVVKTLTDAETAYSNLPPRHSSDDTADSTKPAQSSRTGDAGIAIYAAMSLLSVTGGTWVIGKKRKH